MLDRRTRRSEVVTRLVTRKFEVQVNKLEIKRSVAAGGSANWDGFVGTRTQVERALARLNPAFAPMPHAIPTATNRHMRRHPAPASAQDRTANEALMRAAFEAVNEVRDERLTTSHEDWCGTIESLHGLVPNGIEVVSQ
jgi:hypothetical protein